MSRFALLAAAAILLARDGPATGGEESREAPASPARFLLKKVP